MTLSKLLVLVGGVVNMLGVWGMDAPPVGNYQPVPYIESTGRQWINTGYHTTATTAIEIDFTITGDFDNRAYFCGDWLPDGHLFVGNHAQNGRFLAFFATETRLLTNVSCGRYRFVTVPGGEKTALLLDGTTGKQISAMRPSLTRMGTSELTLFAADANGAFPAAYRLHAFRLTETTTGQVVRDYVPMRRLSDGALGLLDRSHNVFYPSNGPDPFLTATDAAAPAAYPALATFNPNWMSAYPGMVYSVNLPTAALLGNGSLGAVNGGDVNRKFFELTRGDLWSCGNMTRAKPIAFGYLEIACGEKAVNSIDTLDIATATLRTEGPFGKGTVKLESFVAAGEDLFVVRGVSSVDDEWTLRFTAHSQSPLGQAEAHEAPDGFWVRRSTVNQAPQDPHSWTTNATASVSAVGASLTAGVVLNPRSAESKLKIKANQPFAIVVAPDPARRFNVAELDQLQTAHVAWWRDWWNRSRIALGDTELERFYYGQLYLLGAGVRQGKFPPGLYGIWPTTDAPSWSNDFHLNYNYMATYYGCFTANRPEVAETMPDPLLAYLPRALENAKHRMNSLTRNYNGAKMRNTRDYLARRPEIAAGIDDAALFPVGMGPWGLSALGDTTHCGQISDGVFQCAMMCTHWEYTLDRAYLKKVWPIFDKTANFFLKWCEKEMLPNGGYRYVVYDSHWEGSGMAKNSVPALGAVRRLFATLVAVTPVLREMGIEVSEAKAAAWRDFDAHMSDFATGMGLVDGKPVRMHSGVETADGTANLALCANAVTLEHIIPGEAYAFDLTAEGRALVTNAINGMLSGVGEGVWTRGCNQTPKLYAMAIRVGYPCQPIIDAFKKFELHPRLQRNFHLRDNTHGVEKIGAMEFINSMLLQSDHEFVKVFPNWTGANAKFEHLRAKGAFIVSAELKGGMVVSVEVTSEKGGVFRLVDPFGGRVTPARATRGKTRHSGEPTLEIRLNPGESVRWTL